MEDVLDFGLLDVMNWCRGTWISWKGCMGKIFRDIYDLNVEDWIGLDVSSSLTRIAGEPWLYPSTKLGYKSPWIGDRLMELHFFGLSG